MSTQSFKDIPSKPKATIRPLIPGGGKDIPINHLDIRCGLGTLIDIDKVLWIVVAPITNLMEWNFRDDVVKMSDSVVRS
jgi:hypothetical protein